MGGAQAIAALALGTEGIDRVDMIVGRETVPSSRRSDCSRRASGSTGSPGRPSSWSSPTNRPIPTGGARHLRAGRARDRGLLAVLAADGQLLDSLVPRCSPTAPSAPALTDAAVSLVEAPDVDAALALADALAPRRLELQLVVRTRRWRAGASPGACSSAPTPERRSATTPPARTTCCRPAARRDSAGRWRPSFLRRTTIVSIPARGARALAPAASALARIEGFPVHGESVEARAGDNRRSHEPERR